MRRSLPAALLLALTALASPAGADEAQVAPESSGWWQVGAMALVTGAGLEDGELLVEGLGSDEGSRQAVAALSFALDGVGRGEIVTVPISSSTPHAASVHVCAVTQPFEPAYGGPPDAVPEHDCSGAVVGSVDGENLVIENVGGLGDDRHLRILLVPNGAGRIVLDARGATLTTAGGVEGQIADGAPASPPAPTAPPAPAALVVPAPVSTPQPSEDMATPPVLDQPTSAAAVADAPSGGTLRRFAPPTSDRSTRMKTALVLGVALGAFSMLHRDTARLRPRAVAWRRGS